MYGYSYGTISYLNTNVELCFPPIISDKNENICIDDIFLYTIHRVTATCNIVMFFGNWMYYHFIIVSDHGTDNK